MLKILSFFTLIWVAARFVYGLDFAPLLELLEQFIVAHNYPLQAAGVLVALCLPGITRTFEGLGLYSLMYSLARLFFFLSTILVCLVSLAAVLFWFDLGVNLWAMLGLIAALPILIAGSAAFSLHIADFNYPVKASLVPLLMLAGLSAFVVFLAAYYGI
ncbi:hypothetical protein [Desulfurivibrio alkaliphilus]|uniref:Uncharacterized protein n=1 Tax=Desulfurivibrio alkaliphilus (strain DSM 19089 / UNIQEM U267 / AHT2) TaxID=589865 RepID=D6Z5E1_DESAT|nr:hypothetical protein [Desulfurivibrio alkaliphilus]ADH84798.1 hypothetical protein DaAHT2_0085 [Desulfurivibrio alkaliphilus AHT 2]